jgi:hypothetical protein
MGWTWLALGHLDFRDVWMYGDLPVLVPIASVPHRHLQDRADYATTSDSLEGRHRK